MSEQIELFTPAVAHKEKALGALQRFAIGEAKGHVESARQIDAYLADLGTLTLAVDVLLSLGIRPKTKPSSLARVWARIQRTGTDLPRPVRCVVEALLCERIVQLLPGDFCEFLDSNAKRLHVGTCYLVLNRPEQAHKKLLHSLSSHPAESYPRLWGYFADASFLPRRREEANSGYLRALLMDPQAVDVDRLKRPDLRCVVDDLRAQHEEETARGCSRFTPGWKQCCRFPGEAPGWPGSSERGGSIIVRSCCCIRPSAITKLSPACASTSPGSTE